MDRIKLRQVLIKKTKKELEQLVETFSRTCSHFEVTFEKEDLDQETLASKLWSILLDLKSRYPFDELQDFLIDKLGNDYEKIKDIWSDYKDGKIGKKELFKRVIKVLGLKALKLIKDFYLK